MMKEDICANLNSVKRRIKGACERSGRNPDEVRILAVSKTKPVEAILEAMQCGQLAFGENRMKELEEKMIEIGEPDVSWHMIGNLQTNKIKYIAGRVNYIHSVEKLKQLEEINKRAGKEERIINILIQVNISEEKQKGGCKPGELSDLLKAAENLEWIKIKGLMGMAELVKDAEEVRPQFRLLKELFENHKKAGYQNVDMHELSMGMTNDFEVAVEEGATIVRIGSAIFGNRIYT